MVIDVEYMRARVSPDANGCWLWQRARQSDGYGMLWGQLPDQQPKRHLAHRAMFQLVNGPIAAGLVVRHACDVPACVNPAHLSLGTKADNTRDMMERGRGQARLTEEKVATIRERYAAGDVTQAELALEFGVTASAVSAIVTRRRWAA